MKAPKLVSFLLVGLALAAIPALAQEVGTATAVNPLSERTSGDKTVALTVGARIIHKERIHTTPSGTVQLLFLDGSTLSIGPNSSLLIDEFVYDPNSGTGRSVTSLTEGALRFVGGKISHQGGATISTAAATIGIRGGTVTVAHGQEGTRVINHFGLITVQNGAGHMFIRRQGFALTVPNWSTPPPEPERVTEAEIARHLNSETSKPGQNAGVPGVNDALVGSFGVGALQGLIGPNTPPIRTTDGESNAYQTILQATQQGTGTTPPPRRPRTFN
jgi:FecR protein